MVGGKSAVLSDVLPYTLVAGNPACFQGLNLVGLRRRGAGRRLPRTAARRLGIPDSPAGSGRLGCRLHMVPPNMTRTAVQSESRTKRPGPNGSPCPLLKITHPNSSRRMLSRTQPPGTRPSWRCDLTPGRFGIGLGGLTRIDSHSSWLARGSWTRTRIDSDRQFG